MVVAADKSKGADIEASLAVIRSLERRCRPDGCRLGLVAYASRPLPLVDLGAGASIYSSYSEAPILQGRPEPALALIEAYEMLVDLGERTGDKLVILLWSMAARPRVRMDEVVGFLERAGVGVRIVALRPSLPGWYSSYSRIPEDSIRKVRKTTNFDKLAARLLAATP